jgi:hypothetical protein
VSPPTALAPPPPCVADACDDAYTILTLLANGYGEIEAADR